MTIYLKATSEVDLEYALTEAGLMQDLNPGDDEIELVLAPGYELDMIGKILKPDANGDLVEIPGFHANLRGPVTQEQLDLLPVIDPPENPVRVWFDGPVSPMGIVESIPNPVTDILADPEE